MRSNWSYLAGFFDGEGSITVQRGRGGRKENVGPYYTVRLSIANTNREVIEHLERVWKKHMRLYSRRLKDPRSNHRSCFHLEVDTKADVLKFLRGIKPYSIVKKRQIDWAIVLIKHLSTHNYTGRIVPAEERAYRDDLYMKIKNDKKALWEACKELLEKDTK